MSEEQLKAFIEKVQGDDSLQEKLKAAKSPEDVVGIAKEQGYEFTADNFDQVSEEELEGVAGGNCLSWGCVGHGVSWNGFKGTMCRDSLVPAICSK